MFEKENLFLIAAVIGFIGLVVSGLNGDTGSIPYFAFGQVVFFVLREVELNNKKTYW